MPTVADFAQELITGHYKKLVEAKRPDYLSAWPLIQGYVLVIYTFNNWIILAFKNNSPHFLISVKAQICLKKSLVFRI